MILLLSIITTFGSIILLFGISLMFLAIFNIFRHKSYKINIHNTPKFSLIIPAHNEEDVIERTIKCFLNTDYPINKKELIIINDGSHDSTKSIVSKYATHIINNGKIFEQNPWEINNGLFNLGKEGNEIDNINKKKQCKIILINRTSGGKGKSYALNEGIKLSSGEILLFIDADIQFKKDIFHRAALHFSNPNVSGLAGCVDVKEHKYNILNGLIQFEYVIGQQILRRGFNVLGVHYIIPGGCAFIRKSIIQKVGGGYSHDTLAEDTDMTWNILTESKGEIRFDPNIRVLADEPSSILGLWNQRVRWSRGNIQVTYKHRHKIGKRSYGKSMHIFFPFWITSQLLPFGFILSSIGVLFATYFNIRLHSFHYIGEFLAITFFITLIIGTVLSKGKAFWGGLFTPGIPILIFFTVFLFYPHGINGLLTNMHIQRYSALVNLFLGIWVLISIPGTYLCNYISKYIPMLGKFLQVFVFGYWMFLITTIIQGYILEFTKKENIWIRTQR